jgi:hypothetical protein
MNVIETWINNSIREAEYFSLKGTIVKKHNENSTSIALQDYEIDRMTLANSGISNDQIDVLYRSYFVNTVGFYNNLKGVISKYNIINSNK